MNGETELWKDGGDVTVLSCACKNIDNNTLHLLKCRELGYREATEEGDVIAKMRGEKEWLRLSEDSSSEPRTILQKY